MNLKTYDLVKVVKQPTGLGADLFERVCVVAIAYSDSAYLIGLKLDGSFGGAGLVPMDHLEDFTPDEAENLALNFQSGFNKKCRELAQRFGLDSLDIEDIYTELLDYVTHSAQGKSAPISPVPYDPFKGKLN